MAGEMAAQKIKYLDSWGVKIIFVEMVNFKGSKINIFWNETISARKIEILNEIKQIVLL